MNVIILGFESVAAVDKAMEKLVEESGRYIFNVVVTDSEGVAAQWARERGAPIRILKEGTKEDWMVAAVDYVVFYSSERSPQWMKNLVMKIKAAGKHGTIVKGEKNEY